LVIYIEDFLKLYNGRVTIATEFIITPSNNVQSSGDQHANSGMDPILWSINPFWVFMLPNQDHIA
jgi:hypothetical protein